MGETPKSLSHPHMSQSSSPELPEASPVLGAVCLLLLQPPLPATSQRDPAVPSLSWQRPSRDVRCWGAAVGAAVRYASGLGLLLLASLKTHIYYSLMES